MVLLAIAVWSRHNYKVSASILRANSAHAFDRPCVVRWRRLIKDVQVMLVGGALVLVMLLVVLLAAQLVCRAGPRRTPTAADAASNSVICNTTTITDIGRGHARQQQLVAVSGVLWAEGGGKRVGNKLVFTFTSCRRGREGAGDRLLAGLCRAWPRGASGLLCVRVGDKGASAVLLCDGAAFRDSGLGRRRLAAALEALLHLADACLEGFELGRGCLDDLLAVKGEKACLSAWWSCSLLPLI